ncbi:MAG: VWA domain-containing protein, partial [Thermoanaerobaculia bacterium]
RIVITYQVPRAPDTEPRRIEVRARREGLEVTAPRWASSSPPAALAEARAAALLDGDAPTGELPVFVRVNLAAPNAKGVRAGEVEATLDLAKLSGVAGRLASTRMRVTVAVGGDEALPIIIQEILPADLSEHPQLHWSAPLNVESGRTRVAVVFEELMTGAWGGATTPLDARVQELARGEAPKVTIPGDWLFDDERAFAKAEAEAEGKAVLGLAFNRYCAECAAIVVESLTHPAVARKIPSFVRLLIDTTTAFERARKPFGLEIAGMTVPPEPLFPELDQRSYFVVFDPSGRERFRLPLENGRGKLLATAELSEFLGRMEELAPLLVEGASLAREGRLVDATRAFGLAYRRAGDLETAAATFARMRDLARSSGDREAAQTAAVLLGLAHLQAGDVGGASRLFEEVVRDPASPASHAEALLGIGQVRRSRGDERGAAEAFVEAARLAPQGSEVRQAAMTLAGAASDVVHGAISLTPESSIEPLQLIIGGRPPFSGRVEAQALVRDPGIDRVAFFLDDAEVAADDAPPFTARIDLGDLPHPRKLRAAAFGVDGALVAEDLLLVNERHDQFWVELSVDGNRAHVETAEPLGRTLERIDFFLDGRRLRSLSASPWQIDIPDAGETSVLRAVARLDDGTFAEDAALLDPEGYVATIEVNEVELYVTALDDGEPVRDLTAADFTVLENGDRKRIHGFEFLEGAPWTAGIAMDSSGSMTLVLPDVQEAARDFAARTIGNGGRAFVVDFDGAPRLAHPTTSDLGSVSAAIDRLTAGGGTALYDAIIFGLLQLQGLDGKRALVVLTDGEDRASRYDYKEAIRVAQESGAAVYAIILDETGPMFSVFVDRLRRELETLARVTGGEAWYLRTRDGIAEVYERIDRELRNQYVLTYGTEPAAGDGEEWRDVEVRARRRGVRVKSIDGYFVR